MVCVLTSRTISPAQERGERGERGEKGFMPRVPPSLWIKDLEHFSSSPPLKAWTSFSGERERRQGREEMRERKEQQKTRARQKLYFFGGKWLFCKKKERKKEKKKREEKKVWYSQEKKLFPRWRWYVLYMQLSIHVVCLHVCRAFDNFTYLFPWTSPASSSSSSF